MTRMERNQKVQAFPTQRPAEPFAQGICLWRPHRRSQHPHSHSGYLFVQFLRESAVPVVNEVSKGMTARERLPELLHGPFRRGVGGRIVMEDSTSAQVHDH